MKKTTYLSIFIMMIFIGCKSSASSTSSISSSPKTSSAANAEMDNNTKNNNTENQQGVQEIKDPKGVSTKSPLNNQSTPMKKYPSSGN